MNHFTLAGSQPKRTHVIWESLECCASSNWIFLGKMLFISAADFHRQVYWNNWVLDKLCTLYSLSQFSVSHGKVCPALQESPKQNQIYCAIKKCLNYCSFIPFLYFFSTLPHSHLNSFSNGHFFCTAQQHWPSLALVFNSLVFFFFSVCRCRPK